MGVILSEAKDLLSSDLRTASHVGLFEHFS
jgi:hypothetical protein